MATTKLTGNPAAAPQRKRGMPDGVAHGTLRVYMTAWTITLAGALAVRLAGHAAESQTRALLGLSLQPHATPAPSAEHALALCAHNIPIAAWPLLLGPIGASHTRIGTHTADVLVLACLCANTLIVGLALGGYGIALLAYTPQLPVEYAGLALGYGNWIVQRDRSLTGRERLRRLALISATLLCAAAIETYGVPHRAAASHTVSADDRRSAHNSLPHHTARRQASSTPRSAAIP